MIRNCYICIMLNEHQDSISMLSSLSEELGFADFGIARAEALTAERERYLSSLEKGYFADMEYLSRNVEKRFNPQLLVEGAKSVLVFLAPYGEPSGSGVASYALGEDYHKIIKDRLYIILTKLTGLATGRERPLRGRVFTDSAPVPERAWAVKAGLGFIGKNNFLISRKAGIRTLIGIIITDIELPVTSPENDKKYCGACTRCLEACPTGALCSPYRLDARKCISYQTIENKALSELLIENKAPFPRLYGRYFGCDACLDACPWNGKNRPGWPEFSTRRELLAAATPPWWARLTENDFRTLFSDSPLLRSGLENIKAANRMNESGEHPGTLLNS